MPDRAAPAGAALVLALAMASCAMTPPAKAVAATPACLAGMYDGGQMELAAALELAADGRFRFALSYGALDEGARGRWRYSGGEVRLTSDARGPGMAGFADTALVYAGGDLLLDRHGRALRFRRVGKCSQGQ